MLPNDVMNDFMLATVQATEEAIINALAHVSLLRL
jgi:hypothetical protein